MKELLERVVGSPARLDPLSAHDHSGPQRAAVPAVRPDRAHRGCRERARLRMGLTTNGSRRGRRQPVQPGASGRTVGRTGHSSARRREAREHPGSPGRSQRQRSRLASAPALGHQRGTSARWHDGEVSRARFVGTLSVLHHRHDHPAPVTDDADCRAAGSACQTSTGRTCPARE